MKYNIGFTLGDPRGDGHACTTDYHIVANHSADEISKAYKETTKLLGFDFIKEVGVDFQSNYWIPERFTKELLKLGIIDEKYVRELDLSRQVGMSNMYRNLHKKFNVSILAVTHTLFPILAREEMFYFEFRKMVSSKLYCWMKTGYNITAEKLEENERKED